MKSVFFGWQISVCSSISCSEYSFQAHRQAPFYDLGFDTQKDSQLADAQQYSTTYPFTLLGEEPFNVH
jgi:hypothetical protein